MFELAPDEYILEGNLLLYGGGVFTEDEFTIVDNNVFILNPTNKVTIHGYGSSDDIVIEYIPKEYGYKILDTLVDFWFVVPETSILKVLNGHYDRFINKDNRIVSCPLGDTVQFIVYSDDYPKYTLDIDKDRFEQAILST